jgi:DNA-binding protein H-NS
MGLNKLIYNLILNFNLGEYLMARTTVAVQLQKIRKEREALEKREKALMAKTNDKVLSKIVALAKDAGLTASDIAKALGQTPKVGKVKVVAKRTSTLAGKKVAPKYRNPANPTQTWTGRGVSPAWAQALKASGQLDSALIA